LGNVVFEPQVYPLPPTSTGNEGNSITSFFNNLINTILGPFIGGTVQLGPSHILTPGSEWSGLTTVPPAIGSSGMVGFDAPPIAMWDMVPFQELSGSQTMNVGVIFEDFFWFILNPHYGLKKFTKEHAHWHHEWYKGVPALYIRLAALTAFCAIIGFFFTS
jgi:hypothetical protein